MCDLGDYLVAAEADWPGGAGGPGGPVVVFVSGLGEPGTVWRPVLSRLRSGPRAGLPAVTYDRAGIGASQPRPDQGPPHPYSAVATELRAVLDGLGVDRPAVLVGHSFGCSVVRTFASRWPRRVAGLVLVEASVPQLALWRGSGSLRDGDDAYSTLLDVEAGAAELAGERLPPVPAVVLTRTPGRWPDPPPDPEIDRYWQARHRLLADQLNAAHVIALDAGHRLIEDATDLVALAIEAVLDAIADNRPVTLEPDAVTAAAGRLARRTDAVEPTA
jgi:pimeloyl-ACP methyl ester carboxylesterase